MELIGHDNTSFNDFEQPNITSYFVSDITDVGNVFVVGDTITIEQFKEAQRLNVIITDGTNLITAPTSSVKIYINLFDSTEIDDTSVPFVYPLTSAFEFGRISK